MRLLSVTLMVSTLLVTTSHSWAEVYEFTDNQGVVHFVDNPASIPKKYRGIKKVRSDFDDGAGVASSGSDDAQYPDGRTFEEIKRSAERGVRRAQNNLALMYMTGDGVQQNKKEAIRWFLKSASQGYATAEYNLGKAYYSGDGVPRDLVKAEQYFRAAAEKGDAMAQTSLAAFGGAQGRHEESFQWYKRAAENGDATAMRMLADRYARGIGVRQDTAEAQKWYRKAAEAGFDPSITRDARDILR